MITTLGILHTLFVVIALFSFFIGAWTFSLGFSVLAIGAWLIDSVYGEG